MSEDIAIGSAQSSEAIQQEDSAKEVEATQAAEQTIRETEQMVEAQETTEAPSERSFDATLLAQKIESGEGLDENTINYTTQVLQDKLGLTEDEAKGVLVAFTQGTQAQRNLAVNEVFSEVGGQKGYEDLKTWAASALSQEDIDSFNRLASEAKTVEDSKSAIRWLQNKKTMREGLEPNRAEGGTEPSSAIKPIRSRKELMTLMSDSRYESDPAFREAVDRRLEAGVNQGVYDIVG